MLQQLGKCMLHREENLWIKSKKRSFLIQFCSVNIKLVMAWSDPKFLKVQTRVHNCFTVSSTAKSCERNLWYYREIITVAFLLQTITFHTGSREENHGISLIITQYVRHFYMPVCVYVWIWCVSEVSLCLCSPLCFLCLSWHSWLAGCQLQASVSVCNAPLSEQPFFAINRRSVCVCVCKCESTRSLCLCQEKRCSST